MKCGRAGYTVVEVMIFLAVSGVIFVAAIGVFSGRREGTQFTQAMQDLQSQFRSYANKVSTSYSPDTGGLSCAVGSTILGSPPSVRPVFTPGANSDQCILLGMAIQVVPGTNNLYSYPVFGLKTVYNGAGNTKAYPNTAFAASPEPALDNATPPNWLGVETYSLPGGFNFTKARSTSSDQNLLLMYSSLQNANTSNTSGNEIELFAVGGKNNPPDIKGVKVKSCIEGTLPSCLSPIQLTSVWKVCVSDGTKMGQLHVMPTSTGITTTLNMDGCP